MAAPQLNFLTLACADVERMAGFLRALGWIESPESEPVAPPVPGDERDRGRAPRCGQLRAHFGPRAGGFRGFTLGLNLASADEVDRVYETLHALEGAELLEEPFDSPHGFRGLSFRDPEGNLWDVAWKRGSTVTPDGDLTWA